MISRKQYLVIEDLIKDFGEFRALSDISIDIDEGEFVCFLGPSGCGKTTLLRCIAGLELQTSGTISQDKKIISSLPTSQRDFGIVFQSYALFPNLTCFDNIAYGLKNLGWNSSSIRERVQELLSLIGLSDHISKYPSQLSGGEQQRIALARAIATSPNLLLLDEPLSALDAKVRIHLRQELKKFHRRLGLTSIMVTHDQEEALSIADRIFVMNEGKIMQSGTPKEIYMSPISPFVANFIGMTNFLNGVVVNPTKIDIGGKQLKANCELFSKGDKVRVAARPEAIEVMKRKSNNSFQGKVVDMEFLGSYTRIHIKSPDFNDAQILADTPILENAGDTVSPGSNINFNFSSDLLNLYKVEEH